MTKAPRCSRSIPLLKSLHWLPIKFRIQFKICTFVFRCLNDGQPSYLSRLLFSADSVKHLRSNNTNKLKVPRIRTKFGARAFSVSGPTLWNLLPAHLRVAKNISSFRKLWKTHFFDLAFPPYLLCVPAPWWRPCLFDKDGLRLWARPSEKLGAIEVFISFIYFIGIFVNNFLKANLHTSP